MRFLQGVLGLSMLAACSAIAAGHDRLLFGPQPNWVLAAEAHYSPPTETNLGEILVLLDRQVNVETSEKFQRVVRKLVNHSGVQNGSRISLNFDPTCQLLTIHRIEIRRKGETLNRLKPESLQVLQREANLERHMYDGQLSVVALLNDVRVGDEIDYSYSVRGVNPVFGGKFSETVVLAGPAPIQQRRLRLLASADRKININYLGEQTAHPTSVSRDLDGGLKEYTWQFKDLPAVTTDSELPHWYNPYPTLEFSEFASWQQVAEWAANLLTPATELSPDLQKQIQSWSALTNREAQILGALQFVQDEVRYLGIEVGSQSHQPAEPSVVFARRFGDCKDKSVLLCAILKRLGFDAAPALVHQHGGVERHQPSPLVFNHVIARLKYQDHEWWLDPTLTYQRGPLTARTAPDYGHALVATAGVSELSRMQSPPRSGSKTLVRESLTLKGTNQPAELRVVTTLEGQDASNFRAVLAEASGDEITKWQLANYARVFPLIQSHAPIEITDHGTHVQLVENYRVPEIWSRDGWQWKCQFDARSIMQILDAPPPAQRRNPLGIHHHPCRRVHVTTVNLPDYTTFKDEREYVSGPGDELMYKRVSSGGTLTLEYEYNTKGDSVSVEKMADHIKARNRMLNLLGMTLTWMPRSESFSRRPLRIGKGWLICGAFAVLMIGCYIKLSRGEDEI